jgi:hypothetical protein
MELDLPETKPSALQDPETQVKRETQQLTQKDFGQIERWVRTLIGAPVALSSIYARHFSLRHP